MKRFPLGIKGFMAGVTLALALVATVSFVARGAVSNAQIPLTNLSSDPLYAAKPTDKPTMALALSVEYPTVGAQYLAGVNSTLDDTYQNTNEYLGYYDAEGCYAYNDNPTETVASGKTKSDYKRFYRTGAANQRQCSDGFSGNFLNWASNSAVDMLRLALSGGDRYIDTQDLTLLQRAVLPNDDPVCMWNSTNFPGKRLVSGGGGAQNYWGAIPQSMIKEAKGNDIWIANTLNRIYFRAAGNMAGNCDDTRAYAFMGPVVNTGSALPAFAQWCSWKTGIAPLRAARKRSGTEQAPAGPSRLHRTAWPVPMNSSATLRRGQERPAIWSTIPGHGNQVAPSTPTVSSMRESRYATSTRLAICWTTVIMVYANATRAAGTSLPESFRNTPINYVWPPSAI